MHDGVTVMDPEATYAHDTVTIGPDSFIYPGAVIEGETVIGKRCLIGPGAHIKDSRVGDDVEIRAHSVMDRAVVGDRTTIGPSAHLRPESVIGADCRIGNFVETKKAKIADGTKASHLTYLGDAEIGKNVNIGCGTITCNYDGVKKHKTIIEDEVFVGSDTQFIAPVRIGRGAYIGSGSTITHDVPPGALSVARARQTDLPGWGDKKRKRAEAEKQKKKP
jgi:bifunctional UDP-N-acetylglucosamine pyrophosphorylase/glucosamine-1-phosphate N-acetyltransferase